MAELPDSCELCSSTGGDLLWESAFCRIVSVADPDYPGFCRVILNQHVAEMSDLTANEQQELMRIVFTVESAVRQQVRPDKINLASLGNMVPHVHWHIVPRWREDRCFPNPIWAPPLRTTTTVQSAIDVAGLAAELALQLGPSEPLQDGGLS